jgi:hypothetical protein
LEEFHSFQWTSKITGVSYDDCFTCKQSIAWATARDILNELASQAVALPEYDQEIFGEMVEVANTEGTGRSIAATEPDEETGPER